MQQMTRTIAALLGTEDDNAAASVYTVGISIGKSIHEDTQNRYFLNVDSSVQVFAQGIRSDPALKNGFDAIRFSQGNNIIRGYIAQFNEPTVHTFISINGVNAGAMVRSPIVVPNVVVLSKKNNTCRYPVCFV